MRELAARAIGPAVDLAARSVLATPDLTAPSGRVAELWRLSAGLANASYVLLVTAGGVLLLANESLQTRYAVKDVAPRLVVGMVAANTSLWLVGSGIELANALSRALLGPGVTPPRPRPPSGRSWSSPWTTPTCSCCWRSWWWSCWRWSWRPAMWSGWPCWWC